MRYILLHAIPKDREDAENLTREIQKLLILRMELAMTLFHENFNTVVQNDLADIGPGFFLLGFELGGTWIKFSEALLERFHMIARQLYHQTSKGGGRGNDAKLRPYMKIVGGPLHDRFFLDELLSETTTKSLMKDNDVTHSSKNTQVTIIF